MTRKLLKALAVDLALAIVAGAVLLLAMHLLAAAACGQAAQTARPPLWAPGVLNPRRLLHNATHPRHKLTAEQWLQRGAAINRAALGRPDT